MEKGNVPLFILLMLIGIVPGLLYGLFGMKRFVVCPKCESKVKDL